MTALDTPAVDAYLDRIGLDPEPVRAAEPDLDTLARIQAAHVTHVPFENLAIVGDPFDDGRGPGVRLELDHLYEKIVERRRGGYCFELNGLFTSLLDALGYDVHRAAAMVVPEDGDHSTPANHHVVIVALDRPYVVDVGMGSPQMRRPTPLDGEETPGPAAVTWRVVENDRPEYDLQSEFRIAEGDWETRYVFDPTPRPFSYFQATCDYLSTAPESPFTKGAFAKIEVDDGWLSLRPDTFARVTRGERTEREISRAEWDELLETAFGLALPG